MEGEGLQHVHRCHVCSSAKGNWREESWLYEDEVPWLREKIRNKEKKTHTAGLYRHTHIMQNEACIYLPLLSLWNIHLIHGSWRPRQSQKTQKFRTKLTTILQNLLKISAPKIQQGWVPASQSPRSKFRGYLHARDPDWIWIDSSKNYQIFVFWKIQILIRILFIRYMWCTLVRLEYAPGGRKKMV